MILGAQIVHVHEMEGKLALSSTKHIFTFFVTSFLPLHNSIIHFYSNCFPPTTITSSTSHIFAYGFPSTTTMHSPVHHQQIFNVYPPIPLLFLALLAAHFVVSNGVICRFLCVMQNSWKSQYKTRKREGKLW